MSLGINNFLSLITWRKAIENGWPGVISSKHHDDDDDDDDDDGNKLKVVNKKQSIYN